MKKNERKWDKIEKIIWYKSSQKKRIYENNTRIIKNLKTWVEKKQQKRTKTWSSKRLYFINKSKQMNARN